MSDAWHSVKIQEFEHVRVSPSVTLLRVNGKLPRWQSAGGPRPLLLADNGHVVTRVAAIPSPPDGRGMLRAAYSVSPDLISPSTLFSLECSDGFVVALPAPTPGAARLEPRAESQPPPATPAPANAAPEGERRWGLDAKLTELTARLAESEQARSEHEAAWVAARAEAEQATSSLRELDSWRSELERRLTDTTNQLDEARTEIAGLHSQLAEALERAAEAQIEVIGHAAEAEAREQAELELAEAVPPPV